MIVVLGDLLFDITCYSQTSIQYGSHCSMQARVSPGGSAGNFAMWVARLGAEVGLLAKVGADVLGRALQQDLEHEGVVSRVAVGSQTTGLTILISDQCGVDTVLAARGATAALSVADLDWQLLDRADLLHVTAYSFFEDAPRQAALTAMRHVKECGKLLSLDPSSQGYLRSVGAETFFALTEGVDILFPNLDEGCALTGESQPERIVHSLLRHFPIVVLKMGAQGALAATADAMISHPGFVVPAVDTVGAGDAFAAAFVVEWLKERDLAAALHEGNRVAAGVVQVAGARTTAALPDSSLPKLSPVQ